MEFNENEAIYLQIAGYVGEHILRQQWLPDQKIPSVRDLAATLQVNPNTVMRTYELLQSQETIYNKRGLGFFVAPEAAARVRAYRRERFLQQELPAFFATISLLGIDLAEIKQRYDQFQAPTPSLAAHEN
ncbi:GntR family transcriptional regulator [Hymenobacter psoromatis]|uniref:GntR family transcriptional regulator n=1 Tax=Hymenobacter psoromatis TaxID=1484116 RepID=UPI001CBFF6FF|nr:GntR family transcriptional regulator [Hymenobacter psoromatis]